MSNVADALRSQALASSRTLAPDDRIRLALRLGDSDADLLAAARGIDGAAARRIQSEQRRAGRRPSRCAAGN